MGYFIALMSKEVIPGVKPMTLKEIYECDILYYIKLIRYSRKENTSIKQEAFVDLVGI